MALNVIKKHQKELNFYFRLSKVKEEVKQGFEKNFFEVNRWKYCIRWITNNMNEALINDFFHQYFTHRVTEEVCYIFTALLTALKMYLIVTYKIFTN